MTDSPIIDGILRNAVRELLAGKLRLHGNIYQDRKKRFPDGWAIYTSTIVQELPDDTFGTLYSVYKVESWAQAGNMPDSLFNMIHGKAYRLKAERFEHPAGTLCYLAAGYDYGLARDDELHTGKPHVSMTLSPNGENPFFTVPLVELEPVE